MTDDKEESKEGEPQPEYLGKKIVFFKTFEEMNEYDHRQYAALSPSESLSHVTLMRLVQNPKLNTNLNPWGNKVYFD